MRLNDEIARAYLDGADVRIYGDRWLYTSSAIAGDLGKNIFTPPEQGDRDKVQKVYDALLAETADFTPVNRPLWDALFPDWQAVLGEIAVDLIVGFPEPYDATVEYDPQGQCHMIFDLICWTKYLGQMDLRTLARNLMTHELCHVLIHKHTPGLAAALTDSDYGVALDAITFDEGLAHLLSYGALEIDQVNWNGPQLAAIRGENQARMRSALRETDPEARQKNLYDAVCGNYYEKFGCMCGMFYFASCWQRGGIPALQEMFARGYAGFAAKTAE